MICWMIWILPPSYSVNRRRLRREVTGRKGAAVRGTCGQTLPHPACCCRGRQTPAVPGRKFSGNEGRSQGREASLRALWALGFLGFSQSLKSGATRALYCDCAMLVPFTMFLVPTAALSAALIGSTRTVISLLKPSPRWRSRCGSLA
ncbi:hypothetical protein N431DRAFT_100821 [Stipitochalara longipes BDJ]|nr:hypothetical protein N431DRAFT_100821 [Stipitochalara longipes BDJ]